MTFAKTTACLFPSRTDNPPSIASSNLVFHVYIELFLNSCEIIRHRNPTQKNTKAREIRRIVEFSHGELWSFHPENCRVFIRRIVGSERYSPYYTLPLHRITRVRLKTTKHTKHTKHHRSGIIWRAVAPFHEMMIFVPIRGSIHSCPFVSIRGSGFFSCISCVSWFNPFVPIRDHSWFCIFFSCISCVSWFNPFVTIRGSIHSCPFVVLDFPFVYFVCFVVQPIRVHSCPFVSIRDSRFFSCISCVSWFNPFVSIRVHSWFWILLAYFVCFVVQPIRGSSTSFSEKFSGNVGDDLFSVDLFLQLLSETKSYR